MSRLANHRIPTKGLRTCVVCRMRTKPNEMIRLRINQYGDLSTSLQSGRGYWIHRLPNSCGDPTRIISALSRRGVKVESIFDSPIGR